MATATSGGENMAGEGGEETKTSLGTIMSFLAIADGVGCLVASWWRPSYLNGGFILVALGIAYHLTDVVQTPLFSFWFRKRAAKKMVAAKQAGKANDEEEEREPEVATMAEASVTTTQTVSSKVSIVQPEYYTNLDILYDKIAKAASEKDLDLYLDEFSNILMLPNGWEMDSSQDVYRKSYLQANYPNIPRDFVSEIRILVGDPEEEDITFFPMIDGSRAGYLRRPEGSRMTTAQAIALLAQAIDKSARDGKVTEENARLVANGVLETYEQLKRDFLTNLKDND